MLQQMEANWNTIKSGTTSVHTGLGSLQMKRFVSAPHIDLIRNQNWLGQLVFGFGFEDDFSTNDLQHVTFASISKVCTFDYCFVEKTVDGSVD